MKNTKPKPPRGAPKNSTWFGGPIDWFRITVKITGQDLDPRAVSEILECEPDQFWKKDTPILRKDGSVKRIPKFGYWGIFIVPDSTDEWDCGEAAMDLLRRLPHDKNKWSLLSDKYDVRISFALSFEERNKGFGLSNEFLKYIGDRGVKADFDIYHENSTP